MPRPTSGRAYTVANLAVVGEQEVRCYELRLAGKTFRQIAVETGLAVATVHKRIEAHIAQRVQPLADELRAIEVDRLDRYLVALDAQIQEGRAVARNVEVAVRVSERRAKLLGIDAPEKVEAIVTQVTQEDLALAELVREANAAAAVAEARLRGE